MVPPDPLQCLYAYGDPYDREVAAFLAASLAVGRAQAIVEKVNGVLNRIGPHPAFVLKHADPDILAKLTLGFRYRFFGAEDLRVFLAHVGFLLRRYGSLESAMAACLKAAHGDSLRALERFASLVAHGGGDQPSPRSRLVATPEKGSACKRWHLFLRWMVRCDRVDPGGWSCLKPRDLVVPLDTHMFAIARACNLTHRRHADLKTALEITEKFRQVSPEDPVRYDFSLTRMAMREKDRWQTRWKLQAKEEGEKVCSEKL